MENQNQLRIR